MKFYFRKLKETFVLAYIIMYEAVFYPTYRTNLIADPDSNLGYRIEREKKNEGE